MKGFAICLLGIGMVCTAQTPTRIGSTSTSGSCSPAVSGSHNTFTITCQNLPKNLQSQIGDLLEKLVKDQADAQAVLNKLDTCLEEVRAVREAQEPWRLTEAQKAAIIGVLSTFPIGDAKLTVGVIPQDRNASLFGADLFETLRRAGWVKTTDTIRADLTLNPQVVGVVLIVKNAQLQQASVLQRALLAAGLDAMGYVDDKGKRAADDHSIYIAIGAKPPQATAK